MTDNICEELERMRELFRDHPASVGETYSEHLVQASRFSGRLLLAGFACLVHAVLPFLFIRTASRTVDALHDRMVVNRSRRPNNVSTDAGLDRAQAA